MVEITAQVRAWGRSFGVVIPKEAAKKVHLKAGDSIKLVIMGKKNVFRETFGVLKLKRSTADILKEIDKEGWNE